MKAIKQFRISDTIILVVTYIIVMYGAVLRIGLFLQNRNLFIDEANVARNVFERGFTGLAKPLDYEQYAPPVFLWIIKCFTLIGGYSEYAFRLYSLLCGLGSMLLLLGIIKKLNGIRIAWYPVYLLASAFIFIQFSAELKQYMNDVMIILALMLLALKTDILFIKSRKFFLVWVIVGSIAIWTSMPSVFMLAGIFCYYLSTSISAGQKKNGWLLLGISAVWMLQFGSYYWLILKPQANSDYLQNFHKGYFLFPFPTDKGKVMHNWYLFKTLLEESSGYAKFTWIMNLFLLLLGSLVLIRWHFSKALLLLVPIACVMLAAAIHQYSLIPRVALFIMPLLILLIGYGLKTMLDVKWTSFNIVVIILVLWSMSSNHIYTLMNHPLKVEQITEELSFVKQHGITGDELYVHNNVRPAFIYYTQIHPGKEQWRTLRNAHLPWWDVKYDTLAQHIKGRAGFLFTSMGRDDLNDYKASIGKSMHLTDSLDNDYGRVYAYIYVAKQDSLHCIQSAQ